MEWIYKVIGDVNTALKYIELQTCNQTLCKVERLLNYAEEEKGRYNFFKLNTFPKIHIIDDNYFVPSKIHAIRIKGLIMCQINHYINLQHEDMDVNLEVIGFRKF